ncbi:MAG: hypothetical protein ACRC2H_01340 [Silanimonas sp.]
MSTPTDDDRSRRARALFDAQVDAVDGATATALRARRREALTAAPVSRRAFWWWPASGIATAALAVVLWLPRSEGPADGVDASTVAATNTTPPAATTAAMRPMPVDSDPASGSANGSADAAAAHFADAALVELENDADFYAWLATVPDDADLESDTTVLPTTAPHEGLTL